MQDAQAFISVFQSWLGKSEADSSFRTIIDLYNTNPVLPRGYAVKYTDEWCAATISALGICLGAGDEWIYECSCYYYYYSSLLRGQWHTDRNYTPGDIVIYSWSKSNTFSHIGMVESYSNNTLVVLEGNKSEAVARRTMSVNSGDWNCIIGYHRPNYGSSINQETQQQEENMAKPCFVEIPGFPLFYIDEQEIAHPLASEHELEQILWKKYKNGEDVPNSWKWDDEMHEQTYANFETWQKIMQRRLID